MFLLHAAVIASTREVRDMASYKRDGECREPAGAPSLDMVPGRVLGAALPLCDDARAQIRDSMEVIEYLMDRERVVWT
jgi:hypothetical protein